jgi:SAM-dependent methyltransferase
MNDWNAGYVTDIGYTYGWYPELNPLQIALAFLCANLKPAPTAKACELGFGQGLSINLHAAGTRTAWFGNDFNPAQAAFARGLAEVSGADAVLSDESFEAFCQRPDLPEFDFIAMHGIWSWVSDANRAIIIDFIGRKLKPGGVLYVSYNTQPGWASMVPMRDLLAEHAALMGAPGQGIAQRVEAAMAFATQLMAAKPKFANANPQVAQRLADMQTKDRAYLAHEYFNRDWSPMSFASMAGEMAKAKLSFACSANYLDQVTVANLTPEQTALLAEITDPVYRETVRDFCLNTEFRRDYWVKGAQPLSPMKQQESIMAHRVQLGQARAHVKLKITAGLGEFDLKPEAYNPLLDLMADYRPRTIGELHTALKAYEISLSDLTQSILILGSLGIIVHAQDAATIAKARPACDALNLHICDMARASAQLPALASPVTGGGVFATQLHQLFLLARSRGVRSDRDLAQFAWSQMSAFNQGILFKGKKLESSEEYVAQLREEARNFSEHYLPLFDALQVLLAAS